MPKFELVIIHADNFPFKIMRNWPDSPQTLVSEHSDLSQAVLKFVELSEIPVFTFAITGTL